MIFFRSFHGFIPYLILNQANKFKFWGGEILCLLFWEN
ncbi:hypothetical protein B4135_1048 [Caldibacillus debilis]|uniref:Uncharacterized protein n=1 Tax=Caldibacillus debilis TaxID=301148 RepID=A0A150MEN1_9BACI|nr:hypothetical protein B4135_1048 [Caldibacillus debilis]